MTGSPLAYCGAPLDRASVRRGDQRWLNELRAAPTARIIPFWRDQCLLTGGHPVRLAATASPATGLPEPVLLGLDEHGAGVFAVDLSAWSQAEALTAAGADRTDDLRRIFPDLSAAEATTLAHARGLLHWHRNQRFCGACGDATVSRDGGGMRVCADCEKLHFPRIEPAVIVLVESAARPAACLLGRARGAAEGAFATLAGFVEVGESLEDAVRREVAEETGVAVGAVTYQGSQAWPFPAGLMIGFRARAQSDEISVDGDELAEASWFTRGQLREFLATRQPRPDSIERHLLGGWLAETDGAERGQPTSAGSRCGSRPDP
jgi:NAD+ diphosphatase